MENSQEFLRLVLDSITEHIVVIDKTGEIKFVNKSWSAFGDNNACAVRGGWAGVNYIEECDKAAVTGDEFGAKAAEGIRRVIAERDAIFYFEYPCHSPEDERWFMMRVTPFQVSQNKYFVISHQNITERKLAEEKVKALARVDGLTKIPNRRTFDEFLHKEWQRCYRLNKPISVAIVDLDYFKLINDRYGHQAGDECLIRVAEVLSELSNRPSDICARYGGEEFAVVWGDTSLQAASVLAEKILTKIVGLNIPNADSTIDKFLTASIGVAELIPSSETTEAEIIKKADQMLYRAKDSGRNRVSY
ncbi:sensor domain-containing diguanylate cyclase [Dasania marina]|uniref:sensor domain-containing diguanylate cyclase n=1 Tax=Dasania marina TaxID=471499 RepID=UPI00035E811C|nr:sensor domain-containing diguanylate cyclase [Dasania marina]